MHLMVPALFSLVLLIVRHSLLGLQSLYPLRQRWRPIRTQGACPPFHCSLLAEFIRSALSLS